MNVWTPKAAGEKSVKSSSESQEVLALIASQKNIPFLNMSERIQRIRAWVPKTI